MKRILSNIILLSFIFQGLNIDAIASLKQIQSEAENQAQNHAQQIHAFNLYTRGTFSFATVGGDNCDFNSIQAAVDSAVDEVRIATNTTYNENIFLSDLSINLRGGFSSCSEAQNNIQGQSQSIIVGVVNASEPVIAITGNTQRNTISLENLDLSGGTGTNFLSGGGISTLSADVNVSLVNMNIHDNDSTQGGGIAIQGNSEDTDTDFLLINTLIHNNTSTQGGGIYCTGANSSVLIVGDSGLNSNAVVMVDQNTATGNGGGAYITQQCHFSMYSGTKNSDQINDLRGIAFNSSNNKGGGLYADVGAAIILNGHQFCFEILGSTVCLGDNQQPLNINNNFSEFNGGGVFATSFGTVVSIYAGLVENNILLDSGSSGAGISTGNAADLITARLSKNCWSMDKCNLYRNNQAKSSGGALYIDFGDAEIYSTFFENNRANKGTVIHASSHTDVNIQGSIFSHNGDNGSNGFNDKNVVEISGTNIQVQLLHNTFVDNNSFSIINANFDSGSVEISYSILHESNPIISIIDPSTSVLMPSIFLKCLMVHEINSINSSPVDIIADVMVDDPVFVDRNNGDYHLNAMFSPAVDFCNSQDIVQNDIDAEAFGWDDPHVVNHNGIADNKYDIGADETYGNDIIFKNGFE